MHLEATKRFKDYAFHMECFSVLNWKIWIQFLKARFRKRKVGSILEIDFYYEIQIQITWISFFIFEFFFTYSFIIAFGLNTEKKRLANLFSRAVIDQFVLPTLQLAFLLDCGELLKLIAKSPLPLLLPLLLQLRRWFSCCWRTMSIKE